MLPSSWLTRFGGEPEAVGKAFVGELDAFEALPAQLAERWLEPPRADAWSPAQVAEHVLKVNLGMSKTLYILRRDAPMPRQNRTPGALEGGKAQSPPFALPGEPQPWEALKPRWREMRSRFLAEVEATHNWHGRTFFHPYFGDLDALGWLQAATFHMAHHRTRMRRPA